MTANVIPQPIAEAVATMTAPYLGGHITPADIQERLCPQEPKEELLTVFEVRDRLKVSLPTVHRMLSDSRLKKIKIGRSVRVPSSSVDKLLK